MRSFRGFSIFQPTEVTGRTLLTSLLALSFGSSLAQIDDPGTPGLVDAEIPWQVPVALIGAVFLAACCFALCLRCENRRNRADALVVNVDNNAGPDFGFVTIPVNGHHHQQHRHEHGMQGSHVDTSNHADPHHGSHVDTGSSVSFGPGGHRHN